MVIGCSFTQHQCLQISSPSSSVRLSTSLTKRHQRRVLAEPTTMFERIRADRSVSPWPEIVSLVPSTRKAQRMFSLHPFRSRITSNRAASILQTISAKKHSETTIFIMIEPIANDENRKNGFRFIHMIAMENAGVQSQLCRIPSPCLRWIFDVLRREFGHSDVILSLEM